ncbi:MAG: hypothetical protein ABII80_03240 [bacterium]
MKKLPILISLFAFFSSLFLLASPTLAQEVSLVVSPPRYDLEAQPGETLQKTIKITNNSDRELILRAFVIDFIVTDDAGTPVKVDVNASGRYLASPWFTLDKQEIVIPPLGQDSVIVLVDVPPDALPGGHYAGIFFEPQIARGLKTTVSYTTTQVGTLFSTTVAGDINYDALIKDFSTDKNTYEFGPVAFAATIENQSDTHITTEGTITIKNMLGRTLETLSLPSTNIFPFTSRSFATEWEQVWGFGRYSATLSAPYGHGQDLSRTIYFWIMPYRLIAAILIILLVLIASFVSIRRHLLHRQDTRDLEIDELKRKITELENNKQ